MKSKLFNQFYSNSHTLLLPIVQKSYFYNHLVERLNIFTTPAKREILIKQKLYYIFNNFDLGNIPIVLDEKLKTPKYTKDGVAMFPLKNEAINFFDAVYLITEIMLIDLANKKKKYDDLFASMYIKNIERVFKVDYQEYDKIFPEMRLNVFDIIYNDFINREAWNILYKKFKININDMEYKSIDLGEQYKFEFKNFEILVNVLLNKRIKIFLIDNER